MPNSDVSQMCDAAFTTLEYFPKECVYEAAQSSDLRHKGSYVAIYHDKGNKSCDFANKIVPMMPKNCLKRFIDFYDEKNPVKAPSKEEFVSGQQCQNLAMLTSSYPDCVYEFANELDGRDRRFSDLYKTSFDFKTF